MTRIFVIPTVSMIICKLCKHQLGRNNWLAMHCKTTSGVPPNAASLPRPSHLRTPPGPQVAKKETAELLILLGSRTMVSKQQKPTTRNHLPILVHQCQRCVSFWNGGLCFIFTARHTFFCIDFLWLQLFQCFQF